MKMLKMFEKKFYQHNLRKPIYYSSMRVLYKYASNNFGSFENEVELIVNRVMVQS